MYVCLKCVLVYVCVKRCGTVVFSVSEQRKPHLKTPLSRKERRQLKRKKRKDFDLISQTLHLWERLRKCVYKGGRGGTGEGGRGGKGR